MRVLVTGGAGYVGSALVRTLVARDDVAEVIVYDDLSAGRYGTFLGPRLPAGRARLVRASILDTRRLGEVMAGVDAVVHLAARVATPFGNLDPHVFEQVNHWGTAEVAYAAERAQVRQLVYVSSAAVYGGTEGVARGEADPAAPETHYAQAKYRGEGHVLRLANRAQVTVVRLGTVFGLAPGMRFDAGINKLAFDACADGRVQVFGQGTQMRPFVHIDNASDGLAALLGDPPAAPVVCLVDRNHSVLEVRDALAEGVPGLETLFVNQHLTLRSLQVTPSPYFLERGWRREPDLVADLRALVDAFGFPVAARGAP